MTWEKREKSEEVKIQYPSGSSLVENIRHAAKQYDDSKVNPEIPASSSEEKTKELPLSSRTRSIAEKLGFMKFDEKELDRPTYLRKREEEARSQESFH